MAGTEKLEAVTVKNGSHPRANLVKNQRFLPVWPPFPEILLTGMALMRENDDGFIGRPDGLQSDETRRPTFLCISDREVLQGL